MLLRGCVLHLNWHDARYLLVAVADEDLFALPDELDVGAKMSLEIA